MERTNRLQRNIDSHWMSVADLMAGLLLIFILIIISVVYEALEIKKERGDIDSKIDDIARALEREFKDDLGGWQAEFDATLLEFTYTNPDVLFENARADLKDEFREILTTFFPRYLRVLSGFKKDVYEIRIEGHTSSRWTTKRGDEAYTGYLGNMDLSHRRSAKVLKYIYTLDAANRIHFDWLSKHLVAVGMSSSRVIVFPGTDKEDEKRSRRVTFRVITNAEQRLLCRRYTEGTNCRFK